MTHDIGACIDGAVFRRPWWGDIAEAHVRQRGVGLPLESEACQTLLEGK